MAINVFEGSRRIAKLISVFIVGGFALAIVFGNSGSVWVNYVISGPNQSPVFAVECPADSATETAFVTSKKGRSVQATLCFVAQDFVISAPKDVEGDKMETPAKKQRWENDPEIRKLIPYRMDVQTGLIWGGTRHSDDVSAYTNKVKAGFHIPFADEDRINNLWWSKKLEDAGEYFLGMIASLAALWAFTWATGWIVRGFMGIPRGRDSKD